MLPYDFALWAILFAHVFIAVISLVPDPFTDDDDGED